MRAGTGDTSDLIVRIGVFGGTFDPPHVGHLLLASDACDALALDRLIFVPASQQPLKVEAPSVASAQERLEMVRLAVANDDRYSVDDTEIRRKGLSYTVETLEHLSTTFAGSRLFLLVGEDSMATFDKWKSPGRIRDLATLAVMRREGQGRLAPSDGFTEVATISMRRIDVSSTEIRERLRAGKSIKGFVPDSVAEFIHAHSLYGASAGLGEGMRK